MPMLCRSSCGFCTPIKAAVVFSHGDPLSDAAYDDALTQADLEGMPAPRKSSSSAAIGSGGAEAHPTPATPSEEHGFATPNGKRTCDAHKIAEVMREGDYDAYDPKFERKWNDTIQFHLKDADCEKEFHWFGPLHADSAWGALEHTRFLFTVSGPAV
jgi:hypothetical protein